MGMGSIPDQGTKIRHATWHGKDRNKSDTEQWVNMLTVRVATRKMESIEQEKRGGGARGIRREAGSPGTSAPPGFIVLRKKPRKWRHGPPGGGSRAACRGMGGNGTLTVSGLSF